VQKLPKTKTVKIKWILYDLWICPS